MGDLLPLLHLPYNNDPAGAVLPVPDDLSIGPATVVDPGESWPQSVTEGIALVASHHLGKGFQLYIQTLLFTQVSVGQHHGLSQPLPVLRLVKGQPVELVGGSQS